MEKPPLVYHTFFQEYEGNTPQEVIQAVYEDAKEGTGATFQEWWDYQKKLWDKKYGAKVPSSPEEPQAAENLLKILVDVGALEEGPKDLRASIGGTGTGKGR